MEWINVALGKSRCRAVVRIILNIRCPFDTGNVLNT